MLNKNVLITSLILSASFSVTAEAKLYKWVDSSGRTHYGETIPPEYANRDATVLDKQGRVEKTIENLTPEERKAREAEEAKKEAARKSDVEAHRRDNALLSTFTNEGEIDLARDRSLQQVDARINSVNTMLKSAQTTLDEHLKEKSELQAQNKKLPKSLLDDISESQARVARLQDEQKQNQLEQVNVKARFEADKQRYRELKSGKP